MNDKTNLLRVGFNQTGSKCTFGSWPLSDAWKLK